MHKLAANSLAILVILSVVTTPVLPAYAQAAAQQQAGEVSARLPQGEIARTGATLAAEPGTDVLWDDLVTTNERGRVRITLGDGSTLNVGSESSLRVVQHDEQSRQTDLTLTFGKMRTRVQGLDQSKGQRFEIRTNTAVLGVIGTDFFVEVLATLTRIIVFEGVVLVRNINPNVRGEVRAGPGMVVLVYVDRPPLSPQQAEAAEAQRSIEETEVGEPLPVPEAVAELIGAPPVKKPGFWQRLYSNKLLFIGVVAAIAAVSISVPVAATTGGKKATGCSVPEPECPVSGP